MSVNDKEQRYLAISKQITELVGGRDNIIATAHCATRLRIVLKDYERADLEKIEDVDLVKGQFVAGNQLQIIFGAGLVNEVYEVFSRYTGTENSSLGDVKAAGAQKMNPLQAVIKSLSDVFIDIMPGILAAALLLGLTGVLSKWDVVTNNATLSAINRLASLASSGIFNILPMAVCYSACKRYGGKPILGLIVGAIMLDASLANAYDAAQGLVQPEVLNIFGLNIELVGFQGGIIIALMMGFIVAKLDIFFDKKIPDVVKLLFSPLCTVLVSTVLLFTIVGPVGRGLSNGITFALIWVTENLGALGYMIFAGVQQIIVITGLHHIFGAIEAQLLSDTGRNFLNPLMSVALMGQGGAVLGYLALHWKNNKTKELCIPSFASTLFGISEPAIFGVNLRYKFPLVGGCIAGALAGGYVYLTDLASLGFGTTGVPGIAICDPANGGYLNYIVAHLIALGGGALFTIFLGKVFEKKTASAAQASAQPAVQPAAQQAPQTAETKQAEEQAMDVERVEIYPCAAGTVKNISQSRDASFAAKTMGDGIVIEDHDGTVCAPCDGTVSFVFPSRHAVGVTTDNGAGILIHCGIDTVKLDGEGFECFVQEGQRVKKGELLIRFDEPAVRAKGYDTEIMMTIEPCDGVEVSVSADGQSGNGDVIAVAEKK